MTKTDAIVIQAGWYPDPMGLPLLRWWNTTEWTEAVATLAPIQGPVARVTPIAAISALDEIEAEAEFDDDYDDYASAFPVSRTARANTTWDIPVVDVVAACRCCGEGAQSRRGSHGVDVRELVALSA